MPAKRPQPRFPEPDTQPFWEATKRHELTYQTCDKCNAVVFYSRRHCTACGSGGASSTSTRDTSAAGGPIRQRSISAWTASGSPQARISTSPVRRFLTQPVTPIARAVFTVQPR